VGAVLNDGSCIVTTPNRKVVFDPPLGGDRSLFLRTNLRFGDDDPLQWPQLFLPNHPHLPCILTRPLTNDPLIVMWRLPDLTDFVAVEGGVLEGVGKLERGFFVELQQLSLALLARAKIPRYSKHVFVSQSTTVIKNLLHRLEFIATNFRKMQVGVRETQRAYLELRAALDYEEIYRPRMEGIKSQRPPVVTNVMGAFTIDLTNCDRLFRAGIPVWLVRPYSELHSIRVKKLVPLQVADGIIPLHAAVHPTHPTIYCGGGDDITKYYAIAQHTTGYLRYHNAFGSIRAKNLVTPPPAQTKKEERRRRYTPCEFLCFGSSVNCQLIVIWRHEPAKSKTWVINDR
jgi:hypothetical protein